VKFAEEPPEFAKIAEQKKRAVKETLSDVESKSKPLPQEKIPEFSQVAEQKKQSLEALGTSEEALQLQKAEDTRKAEELVKRALGQDPNKPQEEKEKKSAKKSEIPTEASLSAEVPKEKTLSKEEEKRAEAIRKAEAIKRAEAEKQARKEAEWKAEREKKEDPSTPTWKRQLRRNNTISSISEKKVEKDATGKRETAEDWKKLADERARRVDVQRLEDKEKARIEAENAKKVQDAEAIRLAAKKIKEKESIKETAGGDVKETPKETDQPKATKDTVDRTTSKSGANPEEPGWQRKLLERKRSVRSGRPDLSVLLDDQKQEEDKESGSRKLPRKHADGSSKA
jgi:hypothetical protein